MLVNGAWDVCGMEGDKGQRAQARSRSQACKLGCTSLCSFSVMTIMFPHQQGLGCAKLFNSIAGTARKLEEALGNVLLALEVMRQVLPIP